MRSYTVSEAATQLGLTENVVRQLFRDGAIGTFKIGRRYRTTDAALEAYRNRPAPDFVTVSDAADLLQASPTTVQRLCREGDIAATKVGGAYRIDPADLERFTSIPA